ncbi:MAG: hypothetical protein ACRDNZ_03065 [Streptosporangiaceae bacterium]
MLAKRRVLRDLTAASVGAMAVLAAVTVTHGPPAAPQVNVAHGQVILWHALSGGAGGSSPGQVVRPPQ